MRPTLRIAIVGAESTGKSTLAHALGAALLGAAPDAAPDAALGAALGAVRAAVLQATPAAALAQRGGPRVAIVDEWLRTWCEAAGRTPRAGEQRAILREQHARIEAAAAGHAIVVADTTALNTAVYSRLLFGDRSLEAEAVERHRSMDATLLTAIDLPWVADGHQRDGPQVREPVDSALRELLARHRLPFAVIGGQGPARLAQALAALRPLLG